MNNVVNLDDYRKQELYLDERTYFRKHEAVPFFLSAWFVGLAQWNLFMAKLVLGGR